jgi:hypothetical protein
MNSPRKPKPPVPDILQLQRELAAIRAASLVATRNGHFITRAKLDVEAARLNRAIEDIRIGLGELQERIYGI